MISGSSQGARESNERTAKQAVYKAISYLLGLRCERIATTFIMQPSVNGLMVDCLDVHHRVGMRRLRPTAPVGLFSLRLHPAPDKSTPNPWVETLDGSKVYEVRSSILPDFSTDPLAELEVFVDGDMTTVALPESDPSLDSPFTITPGAIVRNAMERYRSEGCKDEWLGYLVHSPCKSLVRDVFILDDLYVGTVPEITLHVPSPKGTETVRHPGLYGKLNTLDLATRSRISAWEPARRP